MTTAERKKLEQEVIKKLAPKKPASSFRKEMEREVLREQKNKALEGSKFYKNVTFGSKDAAIDRSGVRAGNASYAFDSIPKPSSLTENKTSVPWSRTNERRKEEDKKIETGYYVEEARKKAEERKKAYDDAYRAGTDRLTGDPSETQYKLKTLSDEVKTAKLEVVEREKEQFEYNQNKKRGALSNIPNGPIKPAKFDKNDVIPTKFFKGAYEKSRVRIALDDEYRARVENSTATNQQGAKENEKYKYLNEDEKKVLAYYAGEEDWDKANEFLDVIDRTLNARMRETDSATEQKEAGRTIREKGQISPLTLARNAAGSLTAPVALLSNAIQVIKNAATGTYEPSDPNDITHIGSHIVADTTKGQNEAIHDYVKEKTGSETWAKIAAFTSDVGMSVVQNVVRMPLGPTGALVSMGLSAGGTTTTSVLQRGGTPEQALQAGVASGFIETITEKIGIDNLFKIVKTVGKDAAKLTLLQGIKLILSQPLAEGAEEIISEFAGNVVDSVVMGSESEYEMYVRELMANGTAEPEARKAASLQFYVFNVLKSGLAGAASGLFMGTGSAIVGKVTNSLELPKVTIEDIAEEIEAKGSYDSKVASVKKYQTELSARPRSADEEVIYNRLSEKPDADIMEVSGIIAGATDETISLAKKIAPSVSSILFFSEGADENGVYDDGYASNGHLYLNTQSPRNIKFTLSHEMIHVIEKAQAYAKFSKYVMDNMSSEELNALRTRIENIRKAKGEKLSPEEINNEIVADYAGTHLLGTEADIFKFVENNRTLGEKILKWTKELVTKLTGTAEEKFIIKARDMYIKALSQTSAKTKAVNEFVSSFGEYTASAQEQHSYSYKPEENFHPSPIIHRIVNSKTEVSEGNHSVKFGKDGKKEYYYDDNLICEVNDKDKTVQYYSPDELIQTSIDSRRTKIKALKNEPSLIKREQLEIDTYDQLVKSKAKSELVKNAEQKIKSIQNKILDIRTENNNKVIELESEIEKLQRAETKNDYEAALIGYRNEYANYTSTRQSEVQIGKIDPNSKIGRFMNSKEDLTIGNNSLKVSPDGKRRFFYNGNFLLEVDDDKMIAEYSSPETIISGMISERKLKIKKLLIDPNTKDQVDKMKKHRDEKIANNAAKASITWDERQIKFLQTNTANSEKINQLNEEIEKLKSEEAKEVYVAALKVYHKAFVTYTSEEAYALAIDNPNLRRPGVFYDPKYVKKESGRPTSPKKAEEIVDPGNTVKKKEAEKSVLHDAEGNPILPHSAKDPKMSSSALTENEEKAKELRKLRENQTKPKDGDPRYYTGIGSRETPAEYQKVITLVGAWLAKQNYVLRSGAAKGADSAFEYGADMQKGQKEIYLPWEGFNKSKSEYNFETMENKEEAEHIAELIHPAWNQLSEGGKKLQSRNTYQVVGKDMKTFSRFIVCYTTGGNGEGGTGQAIRLAKEMGIPVFDFGQFDRFELGAYKPGIAKRRFKEFFEKHGLTYQERLELHKKDFEDVDKKAMQDVEFLESRGPEKRTIVVEVGKDGALPLLESSKQTEEDVSGQLNFDTKKKHSYSQADVSVTEIDDSIKEMSENLNNAKSNIPAITELYETAADVFKSIDLKTADKESTTNFKKAFIRFNNLAKKSSTIRDPDMFTLFTKVAASLSKNTFANMSSEELANVNKLIRTVYMTAANADRILVAEDGLSTVSGYAEAIKKELTSKTISLPEANKYSKETLGEFFSQFGESFHKLYQHIVDGVKTQIDIAVEAVDTVEKIYETTDTGDWFGDSAEKIPVIVRVSQYNTEEIIFTKDTLMTLLLLSERPQGAQHLYGEKDKSGISVRLTRNGKASKPIYVSRATVESIVKRYVTEDMRRIAHEIQSKMANEFGEYGNRTSNDIYGYGKFTEATYVPIEVDPESVNESGEKPILINSGFTVSLSPTATNAVIIRPLSEVFNEHVSGMSAYHSFVKPLEDFKRVLAYKEGEEATVLETIKATYGEDAVNEIQKFVDLVDANEISNALYIESRESEKEELPFTADDLPEPVFDIPPAVDYTMAIDIKSSGVTLNKEISRNFDAAAGKDLKLREKLALWIEQPFFEAKRKYAEDVRFNLRDISHNIIKKYGIKIGSKESAAIQWYGEGYKKVTQNGKVKFLEYGESELKRDFPNTYKKIIAAHDYIRDMYNTYVERMNEAVKSMYPDTERNAYIRIAEEKAEATRLKGEVYALTKNLKRAADQLAILEMEAKVLPYVGIEDAIYELEREIEDIQEQLTNTQEGYDLVSATVEKMSSAISDGTLYDEHLYHHPKNYFYHATDPKTGLAGTVDLITMPSDMNPTNLPKSQYAADAVKGITKYVIAMEYKINMDPFIKKTKTIIEDMKSDVIKRAKADIGGAEQNLSEKDLLGKTYGFFKWMNEFIGELEGETNPVDDAITDRIIRPKALAILKKINQAVKGNVILYNIRSMMVQPFNIPNAAGTIVNPIDWAAGAKLYVEYLLKRPEALSAFESSGFLTERYLDEVISALDESLLRNPEKFAKWLLTAGDKISTKLIWSAALAEGIRLKKDNVIARADDIARRSVAGRGIGEVPLLQQSFAIQFLAPFQVEVNNSWQLFKERIRKKEFYALMTTILMSWLMNEIMRKWFGYDVVYDPINAAIDSAKNWAKDETTFVNLSRAAGRQAGELLSSMPGGSVVADYVFPEETERAKWFGEGDPTRYGSGNLALNTLFKPIVDIIGGKDYTDALLSAVLKIGMPLGGGQLDKTIKGIQDLGVLPNVHDTLGDGKLPEVELRKGSYSAAGNLRFPSADDPANVLKTAAFGSFSSDAGRKYIETEGTVLTPELTSLYKKMVSEGTNDIVLYNTIKEIQSRKKTETIGESDNKREALSDSLLSPKDKITLFRGMLASASDLKRLNALKTAGLTDDEQLKLTMKYYNIYNSKIKAGAKPVEWQKWVDGQKYTDKQRTVIKDLIQFGTYIPIGETNYDKFVASGLNSEDSYALSSAISSLEPAKGKEEVSAIQKYKAIIESDVSASSKLKSYKAIMTEESYAKLDTAVKSNVPLPTYIKFLEFSGKVKSDYTSDGKTVDNSKKNKLMYVIDSLLGITDEAKDALYEILGYDLDRLDKEAPWRNGLAFEGDPFSVKVVE